MYVFCRHYNYNSAIMQNVFSSSSTVKFALYIYPFPPQLHALFTKPCVQYDPWYLEKCWNYYVYLNLIQCSTPEKHMKYLFDSVVLLLFLLNTLLLSNLSLFPNYLSPCYIPTLCILPLPHYLITCLKKEWRNLTWCYTESIFVYFVIFTPTIDKSTY